ncbi:efflux RND transporter periplasmic adaptor subunit [Actinomadura barringtoniae]|nr:peptidoglycan-binding protein [Actinomadura barringtoniae]
MEDPQGPAPSPDGPPAPPSPPPPDERPRRRRRSRKKAVFAVLAIVAAGGVAATALTLRDGDSGGTTSSAGLPPNTTAVTRQTLNDSQSENGKLGFGDTTTVTSRLPGTITRVPDSGSTFSRGQKLYEVDDRPVLLMYGSRPMYRDLKPGVEGSDVRRLERNLSALGYDGFTVDDEYTSDTADAVKEWQDDQGLKETGTVELGRVVFAPGKIRVDSVEAGEGDPTAPGRKVLTYTGTDKAVTVDLETTDQRLAKKGAAVEVTLPDDSVVPGTIDKVSTVIEPGGQGEDPTTKVEVLIGLKGGKAEKAAQRYTMASVDVDFTSGTRRNVLTVPVSALLALQEGGFGVEVVKGTASSYVPVKTGLFASGRVEVSGPGIAEGTRVGVPK